MANISKYEAPAIERVEGFELPELPTLQRIRAEYKRKDNMVSIANILSDICGPVLALYAEHNISERDGRMLAAESIDSLEEVLAARGISVKRSDIIESANIYAKREGKPEDAKYFMCELVAAAGRNYFDRHEFLEKTTW